MGSADSVTNVEEKWVVNPSKVSRLLNDTELNHESIQNQMVFCLNHESNQITGFRNRLSHELIRIAVFINR